MTSDVSPLAVSFTVHLPFEAGEARRRHLPIGTAAVLLALSNGQHPVARLADLVYQFYGSPSALYAATINHWGRFGSQTRAALAEGIRIHSTTSTPSPETSVLELRDAGGIAWLLRNYYSEALVFFTSASAVSAARLQSVTTRQLDSPYEPAYLSNATGSVFCFMEHTALSAEFLGPWESVLKELRHCLPSGQLLSLFEAVTTERCAS